MTEIIYNNFVKNQYNTSLENFFYLSLREQNTTFGAQ